jgi:hypothetical protein
MAGTSSLQTTYRQGVHQKVAFTDTAGTISNGFGSQTKTVRVAVTSAAYVKIENSPTATANDMYMTADLPEYFTVSPGQKVSAIQVSAGGDLHVTEMSQ